MKELKIQNWLVVSNHLKNISQTGNLPQIGVNIKHIWNHHLESTIEMNQHYHPCARRAVGIPPFNYLQLSGAQKLMTRRWLL